MLCGARIAVGIDIGCTIEVMIVHAVVIVVGAAVIGTTTVVVLIIAAGIVVVRDIMWRDSIMTGDGTIRAAATHLYIHLSVRR